MSQNWQVINLDKRQTLGLWGEIGEFIRGGKPYELSSRFIPVDYASIIISSIPRRKTPSALTIAQLLGSLNLPMEILAMIFDEIEDFHDAFCLAYTNTHLLAAGLRSVCALLRVRQACWAGDRVVCIGDYARNEDLPEGMLTAAETQELLAFEAKVVYSDDDGAPNHTDLYRFANKNYQCWKSLGRSDSGYHEFTSKLLPYEKECYDRLADAKRESPSGYLALCNLPKREYVRETPLFAFNFSGLPHDGTLLLGNTRDFVTVLVTRMCWTSSASWELNGGYLEQGPWAGDRFEIITEDALNARIERGEAWRDVTADVLDDMHAILDELFGGEDEEEMDPEDDDTYAEGYYETYSEETDSDTDTGISEEDEGVSEEDEGDSGRDMGDLETGGEE
ncbi:hypothetical protein BOTBODRAFT_177223 [Botryobasidium botryosum FD-172 SS1]|uniref:Uncharacterized protein n=1 Tax=Botryobasidium botryosum (strain FD-172 SS1) TaxID=930990 RepID=A0A067MJ66_BOTB1|nr:hypothetical protein BOTBODRAFT_177223 [Botryobasidium botryosum FD-172 SS1]